MSLFPTKIGLILGSTRAPSNTAGVGAYITSLVASRFPTVMIETIHLAHSPGHPLPLLLEGPIPAAHSRADVPDAYPNDQVRTWSATVLSWDAVIILSPQYNWGIPAPLKNALDQLFIEWDNLPAALFTIGGHGGTKLQESGRMVLQGCHMNVIDRKVEIPLDMRKYIRGSDVVQGDEEWLSAHDEAITSTIDDILDAIKTKAAAAEIASASSA